MVRWRMRRWVWVILGMLATLATICLVVTNWNAAPVGRVYTVEQVLNNLTQHPHRWIGRTVYIRAVASLNTHRTINLEEPLPQTQQTCGNGNCVAEVVAVLTVTSAPVNPAYVALTWGPALDGLVPWVHHERRHEQVYRVQLVSGICRGSDCAQGRLV